MGQMIFEVIRMVLMAETFPDRGPMDPQLWNSYLMEFPDTMTASNEMPKMLEINTGLYFQLLSLVFKYGKMFLVVKNCQVSHQEMLRRLNAHIQPSSSSRLEYLFFLILIVSKSTVFCQGIIDFQACLLEFLSQSELAVDFTV